MSELKLVEATDEPPDRNAIQHSGSNRLSSRTLRGLYARGLSLVFVCNYVGSKPSPRICYSPSLYQDDEGNNK